MHHPHLPLSTRDSLSSQDDRFSPQNSENKKLLASRNSSTRSATFEIGINNIQSSPSDSTKNKHNKQMSNANTENIKTNDKTKQSNQNKDQRRLSPIDSDKEKSPKKPTKQNKHNDAYNESDIDSKNKERSNDKKPTQIQSNQLDLQSVQKSFSSEQTNDISNGPNRQIPAFNKTMRVESGSNLTVTTASPSMGSNVLLNKAYANKSNRTVDSTSVIMPSEVKKRSLKSDVVLSVSNTREATPNTEAPPSNINDDTLINALTPPFDELTPPLDQIQSSKANDMMDDVPLDNNNNDIDIDEKEKDNDEENGRPHNKCRKCSKCQRNCIDRYKEYVERSVCCQKFKRIQRLGRKYITTTKLFKAIILLAILGNCVFIAYEDPTGDPNSTRNQTVNKAENIFAAIFTVEMVAKMLCNGLFGYHMDDNNESSIAKERSQNEKNEQGNDREISKNQINEIDGHNHDNDEKIDPKQEIELAEIGHDMKIKLNMNAESINTKPNKYTKTPSVSDGEKLNESEISSYLSTEKSETVSTMKQQNDMHPDKYVGYFRDNWNILDFVIVVTSWIEWLPIDAGSNFTAIRVLRVLRPLRTFTKVKSLKVLVATIIKSLRGLSDVLVLLLFLFVIFAIIGIQMFNGALHQQCFHNDYREIPESEWINNETRWVEDENFCQIAKDNEYSNDIEYNGCPPELPWCLKIAPNPGGGVTNFDNIAYAILNVFVTISLEGWAAIQYKLRDTGKTLAWLYFVPLTFIVGFFAANLCLAVIESVYGEEMAKKHKKEKRDGDDPFEKKAIEETNAAWRTQRQAKIVIMQSPVTADPHKEFKDATTTTNEIDHPDVIPPSRGNTLRSTIHLNPPGQGTTPTDFDNDIGTDDSFIKMESFRLPYHLNGEESEFRTRIVTELATSPKKILKSKTVDVGLRHHRSQSVVQKRQKSLGAINVDGVDINKVPLSTHQAGLIQTSREWNDIHSINKENAKKRKLNHHKQTSSFKIKKNKKVAFKQGLGLGTKSYMHRYRTGDLPINDTVTKEEVRDSIKANSNIDDDDDSEDFVLAQYSNSTRQLPGQGQLKNGNRTLKDTKHKYKHKKKKPSIINIDTGFMSENDVNEDEDDGTDLDVSTDNEKHESPAPTPPPNTRQSLKTRQFAKSSPNKLAVEAVEERRNRWISSKRKRSSSPNPNKSMQSLSARPTTNIARRDVLKKVDYKLQNNTQENFGKSLERVKKFVVFNKQHELETDEKKYHDAHVSGDFDISHFDERGRVDVLTWAGMPSQSIHNKNDDLAQKEINLSHEIRKRQHKAKKKRKSNEILARRAILIANMRPEYMEWVEARDALWITKINGFVVSPLFQTFIMIIIIANTVVLALTWPQQNEKLKNTLETVNTVFTFIFILEAILKLIGLGPKAYFADNWNKFDFIIVTVSIIELIIALAQGGDANSGGSAISALRSMRLLRAFRLLGKFDKLKQLFMLVVASMHEVSLLTIVLGIFIFMFAALAMSLFGGALIALGDGRSGRWRFDNFYWSWVNVFMVISGDSWNEVMYDTVKATGDQISVIYYVIVVCFGTFVILNLFVAILLSKMGSDESEEDFMLDKLEKYSKQMFIHDVDMNDQVDRLVMSIERKKYIAQFKDKRSKWKHHRDKEKIEGKSLGIFEPHNTFRIVCHTIVHWAWFELSIDILILINCIFLALESPSQREKNQNMFNVADIFFTVIFVFEFIIKVIALGAFQQPFRNIRTWKKLRDDDKLLEWTDRSYQAVFFMHKLNPSGILDIPGLAIECIKSNDGYCIVHVWGQQVLRIVFQDGSWLTGYKLIDQDEGKWEIFEDKLADNIDKQLDKELQQVLTSFDLTDHYHNAYFASNWNRLDAFVVLVAVLGVGFNDVSFLRALRAFRPFRIMVRFKKIKVVLGALLRAIPGLFNTFLFCILFWFVLSILGVNWFNGLYRSCRIDDYDTYEPICTNLNIVNDCEEGVYCDYCDEKWIMYNLDKMKCESYAGLIWWISVFNFDNVFQALHALFCVATLSGWNFVMYEAIDSTEFEAALIEDNNPEAALYFMLVVILCSFFSLNLIVSVVVDNFNRIKAEKDGSAFQTEEQALWVNNQRLLERISLDPAFDPPRQWFRKLSFKIVENDFFDPFIMTCIILNAVSMGLEHYNQSQAWIIGLYISDFVFVIIFILEATLKIAAYGFRLYILSNWNKFDFIISIVGFVGLLTDSGLGLNVLRLFRVARLLRLLHQAKTLKMLFWTLVYSIPSLWNIGLLLFVIFFIYAVVGMHVLTDYSTVIHDEVNADNFWNAVSLLYRVGTEDGWTDVYQSYLEAWPINERYKIYIYFISFFVLGTLVLINLFIAVVLDSFEENHDSFNREDDFITIQIWRDIWSYFDPKAGRELPAKDFIDILKLTPKSDEFESKHKIKGPGFHDKDPFITLYEKMLSQNSKNDNINQRSSKLLKSLSIYNKENNEQDYYASKSQISRRITQRYNLDARKEELKEIAARQDVPHSDIIKLLLRLRLKVYLKTDLDGQLTCFGKLAKLVYDICNSMGIGNKQQSEELIRQHTTKAYKETVSNNNRNNTPLDNRSGLSPLDKAELEIELALDSTFDIGDNNVWYISYDDALLAICSEVIGPRLPDGFEMFQMPEYTKETRPELITQLKIDEWYMLKFQCYDIWKNVKLAIETNKQYAETVPSKPLSDQRQKELQRQTRKSLKFQMQFKTITKQIRSYSEIKEEDEEEHKKREPTDDTNDLINVLIAEYNDMDDDDDDHDPDSIHSIPNLNENGARYSNNLNVNSSNENAVDMSKNSTKL